MNSGLHVFVNIKKENRDFVSKIGAIVASVLLYAGSVLCLSTMFELSYYYAVVIPAGIAVVVVIGVFWERKELIFTLLFFLTVFFAVGFIIRSRFAVDGLLLTLNQAFDCIGKHSGDYYQKFETSAAQNNSMLYVTFFMLIINLVFATVCAMIVHGRQRFWLVVLLAPQFLCMFFWKISPEFLCGALLFAGMFLSWGIMELPKGHQPLFTAGVAVIATALLFSGLLTFVLSGTVGLSNPFERWIYAFRYGYNRSVDYPNGRLRGLGAKSDSSQTTLTVAMSEPQAMYLRGFTGEQFDGNVFTESEPSVIYEHYSLFYWMHREGYYASALPSNVLDLIGETEKEQSVQIRVQHADRRYIYTPYELSNPADMERVEHTNDAAFVSDRLFGADSYSYMVTEPLYNLPRSLQEQLYSAKQFQNSALTEYILAESHYQEYVYDQFATLDGELKTTLLRELGIDDDAHVTVEESYRILYNYFAEQFIYDPEATYSGKDSFVEELFQNKRGYDIHYAAAATLFFRALGIPARYVEGYVLTAPEAAGMRADEPYELTKQNAHAWTEIYRDGIGWYPVEFLDEYLTSMQYDLSQLTDSIINDESLTSSDLPQTVETPDEVLDDAAADTGLQSETGGAVKRREDEEAPFPVVALFCLIWGLLALALVLSIVVRRFYYTKKRAKEFASDNTNLAVRSMFAYLQELCGFAEKTELDLVGEEIVVIGERAAFSPHKVSSEETAAVQKAVQQARTACYQPCSVWKKFTFVWWDCL